MSITWFSKHAKFVVIIGGVFMLAGLIFMGNYDSLTGNNTTTVGEVNGKEIPIKEFEQLVTQYEQQQTQQTGRPLSPQENSQLRRYLFEGQVRSLLMEDLIKELKLVASGREMWHYFENNPEPSLQQDTVFQTNGQYDHQKYLRWIHDEANSSHPYIKYVEKQLESSIIPDLQLSALMGSFDLPTSLEQAHEQSQRESQISLVYASVPLDSVTFDTAKISTEEARKFFQEQPDSFFVPSQLVELEMVKLPIIPSHQDTLLVFETLKDISLKLSEGISFEELAGQYSEDPGSAEKGGNLGGFQTRETWVPEFADMAFSLEPGQVSNPVQTQFGYHIIKCNAIEGEGDSKKVDASHILLRIVPSNTTIDSLSNLLENIKEEKSFFSFKAPSLKTQAEAAKLPYTLTGFFTEKELIAPSIGEFVPGLQRYAFPKEKKPEGMSQVLQGEKAVYLFNYSESKRAGRHFETQIGKIKLEIAKQKKKQLATKILGAAMPSIQLWEKNQGSLPPKITADTTGLISFQAFIPGLGFDAPELFKIAQQDTSKWGPVYTTELGVFVAKVKHSKVADLKSLTNNLLKQPKRLSNQQSSEFIRDYFESRKKSSKIKDNLSEFYSL